MKPMKSIIILMFAVLTGLCSCQVAELSSGRHGVGDVAFSIDEARAFFEADYSAFRSLPMEEQNAIKYYLWQLGLYF